MTGCGGETAAAVGKGKGGGSGGKEAARRTPARWTPRTAERAAGADGRGLGRSQPTRRPARRQDRRRLERCSGYRSPVRAAGDRAAGAADSSQGQPVQTALLSADPARSQPAAPAPSIPQTAGFKAAATSGRPVPATAWSGLRRAYPPRISKPRRLPRRAEGRPRSDRAARTRQARSHPEQLAIDSADRRLRAHPPLTAIRERLVSPRDYLAAARRWPSWCG